MCLKSGNPANKLRGKPWFLDNVLRVKVSYSRVGIIHMSKFKPGSVDKNSSTVGLPA